MRSGMRLATNTCLAGLAALVTALSAGGAAHAQAGASAGGAAGALPAAELFYRPPAIEQAGLSPSGRYLAMTTSGAGGARVTLGVFDLQEWKPLAWAAHSEAIDIAGFHWVDDERLVFNVADRLRGGGDQRFWPGLFSVKRDGEEFRRLIDVDDQWVRTERTIGREPLSVRHRLLHVPRPGRDGRGEEVIVGEYEYDGLGELVTIHPKRLNVVDQRVRHIATGAPLNVVQWFFDPDGEPRLVVTAFRGRAALHWRGEDGRWKRIAEFDRHAAPFWPRHVDSEGRLFVARSEGPDGTAVLRRFDFATGEPAAEAMVSTPGFDFHGHLITETAGGKVLGVRVVTDAESTTWFEPRLAALQKQADERFPGRVNRLVCRQCGSERMVTLLYSFSDQEPGQWWVHHAAAGQWRRVGASRPDIDPRRMGTTDFERVKAEDGLSIPVWITRPPRLPGPAGAPAKKAPRPAVVLVHGGPWVRGRTWDWNADAQFLASRGYVVIEPEFRGSTGYGDRLFRAGFRQWGQKMQDDLIAALDWAVAAGEVDPERVCIAGASYGGYAALMGLARHGERFRCGIAWAGVTDPRLLFQWRHDYDVGTEGREYTLPALVGDPQKDGDMLDANTPLLLAARIKAPLLLAYGGQDRRVPIVHGQRMRDALGALKRPPQWIEYPDEGHGWYKLATRVDFARQVEAFLATHLAPGRSP